MKINVPFEYTTLYTFYLILRFGDKRSIKIRNLFNSRKELLDQVLNDYYEGKCSNYNIENDWEGNIKFEEISNEEGLKELLNIYPEIFFQLDDEIVISDEIEMEDILIMLKEFDMPTSRFNTASDSEKFYKSIGITKIFEDRKKYEDFGYKLEKEIENAYMNNASSKKLKLLLYKRFVFLFNVALNNKKYILEYHNIPNDENKGIPIDDNFDFYLNSEYIKNNEEYPIDKDLYIKSEFYEDFNDTFNPIQVIIDEPYHYSIFGKGPLYDSRYSQSFSQLSMSEMIDDDPMIDDIDLPSFDEIELEDGNQYATFNCDIEEEEFAFYVVYIKKLNDLIEQGRFELINVRNRILYMIDDIKYCLFDKQYLEKHYEQSINYELEEDSFEYFTNEAKYLIEDVFDGRAGKTIEKLLIVATYYEITKDKEIVEVLNRYKNNCMYEEYSKIILGREKGYSKIKK